MRLQHSLINDTYEIVFRNSGSTKTLKVSYVEAILKQISIRETPKETINPRGYMPRVHEVRSPCQWLEHCDQGKCPAFIRLNGNFYCAKIKNIT